MDQIILGTGALNRYPDERRIDRYGTVHLHANPDATSPESSDADYVIVDNAPIGTRGRPGAVIVGTRTAFHLSDLARGLGPAPATVGTEIRLGTGTVFVEESRYGATEIGLRPDDGRDDAWLDPLALYRCHEQTVRLELRPDGQV